MSEQNNLRAQAIELPTRTLPYWSIGEVRAALDAHEVGELNQSSLLAEAMDRDDRISAVLDVRIDGLLGLPKVFEPADADSELAKTVCKIVERQWDTWFPSGDLATLMRWALMVGVGLGEGIWTFHDGLLVPRLKVWHPQFLFWRWDLQDWFGAWQLITQKGTLTPESGSGKWLLLQPAGLRRPWMKGLVRPLARPYLARGYCYRDWARWSEVHGGGIKKATVPSTASAGDKTLFYNSLKTLGSQGLLLLPKSKTGNDEVAFDLELLEAKANESEGFQRLIKETDESIAVRVLGQNLTTSVRGGSRAAAQVHDDVRHNIMAADATMLMQALTRDFLRVFAGVNFGDAALAPKVTINTDPPDDEAKQASALSAVGGFVAAIEQAKERSQIQIPVDYKRLLSDMGVPMIDPEDQEPEPEPDETIAANRVALRAPSTGRVRDYVDGTGAVALRMARRQLDGNVRALLKAIDAVPALPDGGIDGVATERAIEAVLAEMSPSELANVIQDARVASYLAGRWSEKHGTAEG